MAERRRAEEGWVVGVGGLRLLAAIASNNAASGSHYAPHTHSRTNTHCGTGAAHHLGQTLAFIIHTQRRSLCCNSSRRCVSRGAHGCVMA
jgi:hypothetical protein